jgi:acyl-homoserine-lactone acylase
VPWVNTIATSADGRAWYADTSATPNLSDEALAAWTAERAAGGLLGLAYDQFGVVMLDGSDSLYEWVDDPSAPAPGLLPYADLPQLERTDWVFNANDSFWLTHPDELITGFSPLQGEVEVPQSPRTRMNAVLLGESDDTWTIDDVQDAIFSTRSLLADLLLPTLVEACTATPTVDVDGAPVDLTGACTALAGWDGTYDLDAQGAAVFREFVARFSFDERTNAGRLFADGFDPTAPVGTPATPAADTSAWLQELGRAVRYMESLGVPVDAPLGDVQFEVRTGDRIPIHGGDGVEGVANVVGCCAGSGTLQETADEGEYGDDFSYLTDLPGFPISSGASFVMALEFTDDGPVAEGFLTYGNPDDPDDPAYRLGLETFSAQAWRPFRFTAGALDADPDVETTTVAGD